MLVREAVDTFTSIRRDRYVGRHGAVEAIGGCIVCARIACAFVDEAQFLTEQQVWQLARVADRLKIPVMTYGLRTDFRGKLFPGSEALLALADELREVRTICHCGRKATMVVRMDGQGQVIREGAQIEVGGNEKYVSYCRRHWDDVMNPGAVK